MSEETLELARQGFEALARGDLAWFDERTTPDLVVVQPPEVPDAKTYEGRRAIVEAMDDWPKQWDDLCSTCSVAATGGWRDWRCSSAVSRPSKPWGCGSSPGYGAMSRENVELMRALAGAFKRRDHELAFELYAADIEWDAENPWLPSRSEGVYRARR